MQDKIHKINQKIKKLTLKLYKAYVKHRMKKARTIERELIDLELLKNRFKNK